MVMPNLVIPVVLHKIGNNVYGIRLPDIYKKYTSDFLSTVEYFEYTRMYGDKIDAIVRFDTVINKGDQLGYIKSMQVNKPVISGATLGINKMFFSFEELQTHFELVKANVIDEQQTEVKSVSLEDFVDCDLIKEFELKLGSEPSVFKSHYILSNCDLIYTESVKFVEFVASAIYLEN
jgi:hypothetical protein